jgi:hypothetical protein
MKELIPLLFTVPAVMILAAVIVGIRIIFKSL